MTVTVPEPAGNESINRRNKHIDITFHHTKDMVTQKEFQLEHKPTIDIVADLLTEPLICIALQGLVPRARREITVRFEATDQWGIWCEKYKYVMINCSWI